jgi:serine/threonine protein kinase
MDRTEQSDNEHQYSLDDVKAIWHGYIHEGVTRNLTDTLGKLVLVSKAETLWEEDRAATANRADVKTVWTEIEGEATSADDAETVWENDSDEQQDHPAQSGIRRLGAAESEVFGFDIYQEFKLLERIGEGSMGMVFRAYQGSFDRNVVIKMIKPEYSCDDGVRTKFISEGRVTGKLNHPNIVPVYELSKPDDVLLFYVMKYVEGMSWDKVIRQRSEAENLDILLKVCDAVSFAHDKGVIHRDLKPENIILGDYGEVLVMDWGLAVSLEEHGKIQRLTSQTGVGGTPAYMAPEMARRENSRIGPCSDIYLLGGILYQIVTGLRPHYGDTIPDCILAAMNNQIQQPADKVGELLDIALKAMAADPQARYARVKQFQQAIREYQSHTESIALTNSAQTDFERAKHSNTYDDYIQSLFGFYNALRIWPGNEPAKRSIPHVSLAYAQCAYAKGDYDLALSLLTPKLESHTDFAKQVERARWKRTRRQKHLTFLRYGLTGMLAILLLVLLAVTLWGAGKV